MTSKPAAGSHGHSTAEERFRRFKAELHDEVPGLVPTWYAFRDARARRRAVEWLVDKELIDDQSARIDSSPTALIPTCPDADKARTSAC